MASTSVPTVVTCDNCGQEMTSFDHWFQDECRSDPSTGHVLDWPRIMALRWRPVAEADQKEAEDANAAP